MDVGWEDRVLEGCDVGMGVGRFVGPADRLPERCDVGMAVGRFVGKSVFPKLGGRASMEGGTEGALLGIPHANNANNVNERMCIILESKLMDEGGNNSTMSA